jgi:2-polyprenyl-3-methyl-5-hydroxy-6-metoxy-1,4-benzoquinol methylase
MEGAMSNASIDPERFEALHAKVVGDVCGALGLFMAYLGDQAGVYRALEKRGPCTSEALAEEAKADPRYLREWLSANAAHGYVDYDPDTDRFSLSPEQAAIFAHEGQPTCMQGFFQGIVGEYATHDRAVDVFRSGNGRPWADHHGCCFCGVDRFFRTGYAAALTSQWLPALDGVVAKLETGAKVADVGCGMGSSALLMAKAYPNTSVHGFDVHALSIERARKNAAEAGLRNVAFDTVAAKTFPGTGYDLVCVFDALHDMGDPVGAAAHIREAMSPDGTFMLVEPRAGDSLAENLNPVGAIFYSFSTTICVPTSRAQEVGLGLGAQAGQRRLTEVLNQAGFTRVRRATETPLNMVLEARI